MVSRQEFQSAVEQMLRSQEAHALSLSQKEQDLLNEISPVTSGEQETGSNEPAKNDEE